MIINNWYVAARIEDLGDAPLAVRMLGCDFVLFRDEHGSPACLSAVCCHRGGALGRGQRVNNCIQCPYHGWEYDSEGRVRRIPALGDDVRIPARARVDSYPVEERYGHIWVFLGDLGEAERPPLPELLPEYGNEDTWRMCAMQRDWDVNWARIQENLADASHLNLVHAFGKHLSMKTDIFPVEETTWGVRIPQTYPGTPTGQSRRTHSTVVIELSVVGLIQRNAMEMVSGYDQVIWNACTPIDTNKTRHFNLHFRNFQTEPEFDDTMIKTLQQGFDEDAVVINHLQPVQTPVSSASELLVETDGPEKAWRDKMESVAGTLGAIDWRKMRDLSADRVLVIPSPARAAGGKWLHETVPLL